MNRGSCSGRGRQALTLIELLAVVGLIVALVSISLPGLLGALRRGAVVDAGAAVQRVAAQARILARTRFDAASFYGVVLVDDGSGPAYAALTYGRAAGVADILIADGRPALRLDFNRNITAHVDGYPLAGARGWMVQYRTAYPIIQPSLQAPPVAVTGIELRTLDGRHRAGVAVYAVGMVQVQE